MLFWGSLTTDKSCCCQNPSLYLEWEVKRVLCKYIGKDHVHRILPFGLDNVIPQVESTTGSQISTLTQRFIQDSTLLPVARILRLHF